MNEKQLAVGLGKKILAFILDLVIFVFFAKITLLFLEIIIYCLFITLGIHYNDNELNTLTKDIIGVLDFIFKIAMLVAYFVWIPNKVGNTFGRKILKIKDKIDFSWIPFLK